MSELSRSKGGKFCNGMIDVGQKEKTSREARAESFIELKKELIEKIKNNTMPKGNVLEAARIAGIMAAKKTPELIPLCHTIEIEHVGIEFKIKENGISIESTVKTTAKTGVEMEAMTACSVAALVIYDMSKMFGKGIVIKEVKLLKKSGGKSGTYER